MTPLFIAPPELPPPPRVASAIVVTSGPITGSDSGTVSGNFFVPYPSEFVHLDEPDFPDGIDYDTWAAIVNPAPRETFADSLELLDALPD